MSKALFLNSGILFAVSFSSNNCLYLYNIIDYHAFVSESKYEIPTTDDYQVVQPGENVHKGKKKWKTPQPESQQEPKATDTSRTISGKVMEKVWTKGEKVSLLKFGQ